MINATAAGQSASHDVLMAEIAWFMYGIYVVLLILALYLLRRRRPTGYRIFGGLIGAMCIFGTVQVILHAVLLRLALRTFFLLARDDDISGEVLQWEQTRSFIHLAQYILGVTDNAVTDSLLIFRCYVIWKTSHKWVVALPVLLAFATTAAGYVASYQIYPVHVLYADSLIDFLALALATNISLAALMVGRILYTRRNLRTLGQTTFIRRYNTAIKVLLESAVLYLLCLCAEMVLLALSTSTGSNTVFVIGLQLMNIVPALIVVQIGLENDEGGIVSGTKTAV
ncbi:hypothetical protein B0H13DRAFT_2321471 [Mycena leptocephala]|nr:hypothetical protein B0H13DRAFT_2360694 [Mycena leptocephala]KAJ7918303.1 hypothetical protein B0H13DRAFT_2321471 [Mycena leptocephala]